MRRYTREQHSGRNKQTGYSVCQRKMAYLPNTAYAFPVTRGSYHSVERVGTAPLATLSSAELPVLATSST